MPGALGWAGLGMDFLGNLFGGGEEPEQKVPDQLVAPEQRALILDLIRQQYGGGDVGMGADLKAGQATLGQNMASRGIAPTSGVYNSAMGDMTARAVASANQKRFENLFGLISANPATNYKKGYGDWGESGGKWTPTGLKRSGVAPAPAKKLSPTQALWTGLGNRLNARTPTQQARGW
jgi:hypothetical protein